MRRFRVSILGMVVVVALFGVGFAALRSPSHLWESALDSLTIATLTIAVLAAVYRRSRRRAFWVGFATCGWVYYLLAFGPASLRTLARPCLVTTAILEILYPHLVPPEPPPAGGAAAAGINAWDSRVTHAQILRTGGFGGAIPAPLDPWEVWTEPERNWGIGTRVQNLALSSPEPFRAIGHSLFALLFAFFGGKLTQRFYLTRDDSPTTPS